MAGIKRKVKVVTLAFQIVEQLRQTTKVRRVMAGGEGKQHVHISHREAVLALTKPSIESGQEDQQVGAGSAEDLSYVSNTDSDEIGKTRKPCIRKRGCIGNVKSTSKHG